MADAPVTGARRSHLAPFREGARPWLVIARNAIPVAGAYGLGWSSPTTLLQFWADGATALGAMLGFQVLAVAKRGDGPFAATGWPRGTRTFAFSVVWLLLWLLLGIPYWFAALFAGGLELARGGAIRLDDGIIMGLALAAISNVAEEMKRGYDRMTDRQIRLEFNWDFSMHLARIGAVMLVAFFLRPGVVIGVAVVLAYIEIYPMRALRLLCGDKTLDAENENRSRD